MNPPNVTLHAVHAGGISPADVADCLTPEEKQRATSFKFPADAARWSEFRAALRRVLGMACGIAPVDVPIMAAAHGKPSLAPPFDHIHFNLSHSDEAALIAVSGIGPLGVDLEPRARAHSLVECADFITSAAERETAATMPGADRPGLLLELWTFKEAYLKAIGTGLSIEPSSLTVQRLPDGRAVMLDAYSGKPDNRFTLHAFDGTLVPGHHAVLAAPEEAVPWIR